MITPSVCHALAVVVFLLLAFPAVAASPADGASQPTVGATLAEAKSLIAEGKAEEALAVLRALPRDGENRTEVLFQTGLAAIAAAGRESLSEDAREALLDEAIAALRAILHRPAPTWCGCASNWPAPSSSSARTAFRASISSKCWPASRRLRSPPTSTASSRPCAQDGNGRGISGSPSPRTATSTPPPAATLSISTPRSGAWASGATRPRRRARGWAFRCGAAASMNTRCMSGCGCAPGPTPRTGSMGVGASTGVTWASISGRAGLRMPRRM